ncbi:MAG: hypothetical protein ACK415_13070, partial [Thermodesulfovibrionales bacterium]
YLQMPKSGIMLVVYHDEEWEDGLSYTLELARIMNKAISILIIYRRSVMERVEDYMVAVTFAEAGEFMTARELIMNDLKKKGMDYEERLRFIKERCRSFGIDLIDVNTSANSVSSAIKSLLKDNNAIEMVLLSPSITLDGHISARALQRLVKEVSRPVITMTKNIKEKTA